MKYPQLLAAPAALLLAACGSGAGQADASGADEAQGAMPSAAGEPAVPGDSRSTEPYDGIAPDEVLHFTGTEPFWGGEISGATLTYSTPEDQDGTQIAVERFAGRGGLAFGGRHGGREFEMLVTPGACSDGMSDRTYPFTVTLQVGGEMRNGCGWTEAQPFEGPEHP